MIPPPRPRAEPEYNERFNVEERLRSLLDVAEDDLPPEEFDLENSGVNQESLRELDKIGYVVRWNCKVALLL